MYGWCLVFADDVSLSVTSVIHEKRLEIGIYRKIQGTSHFWEDIKSTRINNNNCTDAWNTTSSSKNLLRALPVQLNSFWSLPTAAVRELSATPGVHTNTNKNVNNLTKGSHSLHDFSHHLFKFFMTLGLAASIFSNLISLHKNTVLRSRVCSITTCLFRSETKRYTMKYWRTP